jgi:hypothetical protein
MATSNINFNIQQGESFSYIYTGIGGSLYDFSGYSIRSYIRHNYCNSGYYSFSSEFLSETSGIYKISLNSYETAQFPVAKIPYDVEIYTTGVSGYDSQVFKVLKGYLNIFPEITSQYGQQKPTPSAPPYITQSQADSWYYPLNSNPSGYLVASTLTGYATQTELINTSGALVAQIAGASSGVQSINGLVASVIIQGSNGISVSTTGNIITISDNSVTVESIIPTGIDNYYVDFGYVFSSTPKVYISLENDGDYGYIGMIRDRSVSGCYVDFSENITDIGVKLFTMANL